MKLAHGIFITLILIPVISVCSWWGYRTYTQKNNSPLFKTIQPEQKTITKIIDASGLIKLKDSAKLGSLISGTVDQVLVEENSRVVAGQPLAIINTRDEDYSYKVAQAQAQQSRATYEYQKLHVARLARLLQTNHIAQDIFEAEQAKLREQEAALATQNMLVAQQKALYDQRIIRSPIDGIVVAINISKGEPITTELQATLLFEVAPSLSNMQVFLEIDESDVTLAHPGQKIEITVDSQPSRTFNGKMRSVSYSPNGKTKNANIKYEGIVDILSGQELLRPGMTAHASIVVGCAENTIAVLNQAFFINKKALEDVAKKLNYSFKPLPTKKTAPTDDATSEKSTKTLWVSENNSFVEREVELGITDDTHYAVHRGLSLQDNVVIDVDEINALDEIYKKIASR